ncbi:hypothetical protein Aph01nite_13070 [Acrocarpospora phusangensis]|uniref:Uncharacterized protein n=1 Tax=Acrocarpospora phusangensis TaxID=1070424 RepID=A0A919UM69_9ACTN|nr:hypothetical protein [Acrocarpospora phusangensis]GIH22997.1 hypothetical protein Aph01nite_13070 [Acrocarpospora phusangensis]
MTLRVVDQAEEHFLDLILAVNYTVKLFVNDPEDGLNDTQINALDETDFTEATFTGYADADLTGGSWTTTAGNPCAGTYGQQTFTRSSTGTPQTVYGYYVVRTSDNKLQWYEYLNAPAVIEFNGEYIQVTPRLTLADTVDA